MALESQIECESVSVVEEFSFAVSSAFLSKLLCFSQVGVTMISVKLPDGSFYNFTQIISATECRKH